MWFLLSLISCTLFSLSHADNFIAGSMSYVVNNPTACNILQTCTLKLYTRISTDENSLSNVANWGSWDMGDGTTHSTSEFTPISVESYPAYGVYTYLFEFEKNYTTSSTFGLACETNTEGCDYDIEFTTGSGLTSQACTDPSTVSASCRNNAAGGVHILSLHVHDMSRNAGSPLISQAAMIQMFQSNEEAQSLYVHVEDQTDVTSVENADFKYVNDLTWDSFNSTVEGTRAFNAYEWEDIRTVELSSYTFGTDAVVQTVDTVGEVETSDEGFFFRALNTSVITTTEYVVQSSYPKRIEYQKVQTSMVGCFNAEWIHPDQTSEGYVTPFPICDGNESKAWTNAGNTDGCPANITLDVDSGAQLTKYTCDYTDITETKYSGFMWTNDQSVVSSNIPVQNAESIFIPLSSVTLEGNFFPLAADQGQNGSEFGQGYYFVRTRIDDGLTATSVSMSTLHIAAPLPNLCPSSSTPTVCTQDSDCTSVGGGSCSSTTSLSTITSMARDDKIVRTTDCAVSFDVTAKSPNGFAYAPTTIQAFNLPRGATFGSCTSSGDETTCTFSWTPQSGDAGDHLVCFAGDDTDNLNTLLSPASSCQSIRIIDSADLLKLSLPTYSETGILKCANKGLIWLDTAVYVGNTNEVTLSLCDENGANCSPITTVVDNTTTCTDDGMCSNYVWPVPDSLDVGTYQFKLESTFMQCQAVGTRLFNISKKTPPYTILSPGGVDICGSGGWYKGCGVDSVNGENVITFTLQNPLNISVDVCETSNPSNCFQIATDEEFPAGTNTIDVSLNSTQSIYSFIQANTEYKVRISSTCFADVENTFTVQRRPSDFVGISVVVGSGNFSTWYPCLDYRMSVSSLKDVGAVDFSVSPALFSSQSLTIPTQTSYTHSLSENDVTGSYTISANPTSYETDCIPTNTYSFTVADYPTDTIQVSSPASGTTEVLTCGATNILAVYDSSFDAYNLGDVSWTASIAGGSEIANSLSASSVTLLPSQVGQDLEIVFTPNDPSLSSCVPSVTKTLPIVANDRPLTFSENVLSTWYPCSDVSISWSSVYGEFAAGNVLVNVSLYDSNDSEVEQFAVNANSSVTSYTFSIADNYPTGSYTLRAWSDQVIQGCMSEATKSIQIRGWNEAPIEFTQFPNDGVFMCNSYDFQWNAETDLTSLNLCVCQNCTTTPTNCILDETDTRNKNFPLNTNPSAFQAGNAKMFLTPSDPQIAQCLSRGETTFEIKSTTINVTEPAHGDSWLPFCEYRIDWFAEFALGPLRVEVCTNGNCSHTSTVLLDETTNEDFTFVADPSSVAGWSNPNTESVTVSVVVTAIDYEGASIFDGCNYVTVIQNITIQAKQTPDQTLCLDPLNSAYIPPSDNDNVPLHIIIPACAAAILLVLAVLYYIRKKGAQAAQKEERALELHDMALDRASQHERANVLALETTRPISTKHTNTDKTDRENKMLDEQLSSLNKKLRRAKIIQENLDRDDDFDDDLTRKKDATSGFAAELADDI